MTKTIIHPHAEVSSNYIGNRTRIWQYSVILPDARIGNDCNICSHVFIENDVIIGDRVTIKSGVQLWDGVRLADDVFIGPNVSFCNDLYPRSRIRPSTYLTTRINNGASIGAGSIILPGIEIGSNSMIGAGSVVTRSVPPNAIVVGNPARIVGYVDTSKIIQKSTYNDIKVNNQITKTRVKGVTINYTPKINDIRGNLTVGEFNKNIPFDSKRYFIVYGVPSIETRGEHAHRVCHQFLICVSGKCSVVADDGVNREEFLLDGPHAGIYLPPMTWGIQYKYSKDAVLLVFASEYYDPDDYIRDYSKFLKEVKS